MAKATFNAMKVSFSEILQLDTKYPDTDDYYSLIFQNDNDDAGSRSRNEYILIACVAKKSGGLKEPFDAAKLTQDGTNNQHEQKGKIILGNLPLLRSRLQKYIDDDPNGTKIDHLYLKPNSYSKNEKYVCYEITAKYKSGVAASDFAPENLNPSPPAEPGDSA